MSETMQDSLYARLGGQAAVSAAVDLFYDKVLADPRIKGFFEGVDMERQRRHQRAFLTYAFGGSKSYPGRGLRRAHKHLVAEQGLDDSHFDAVAANLLATLAELGVPEAETAEIMALVAGTRDDVLDR